MFEQPLQEEGPRVWIVGRSALARSGLRALLQEQQIQVLGTSTDLEAEPPAELLVMLDSELHNLPAGTPVLLIGDQWTRFPDNQRVWGLLPSDATPYEVYAAIIALHAGLNVSPPTLLGAGTTSLSSTHQAPLESLTSREAEVLQLVAEGLTNRQMAVRLAISEHTVKFHLSSIFSKLEVASRTEAVRVGVQRGLIVL